MYYQDRMRERHQNKTENIHLLGISGSLRAKSTNRGMLQAASELLPDGMTLEIYDLSEIPMFNQDLVTDGEPPAVSEFKLHLTQADALLIATPEYNHSIPGVLKNAIDWASRPYRRSPLNGKPLGIIGAAGGTGSVNAQEHLRQIAAGLDMVVLEEPVIAIPRAREKFDEFGSLTDMRTRRQIEDYLAALADFVRNERLLEMV